MKENTDWTINEEYISDLLKLDGKMVKDIIVNMPKQNQTIILKNESVRRFFFEEENHYPFIWLVTELKEESLLAFLDENLIKYLKQDSKLSDKLNGLITCGASNINTFLKHKQVVQLIGQNLEDLKYYLNYSWIDIEFAQALFDWCITNKQTINLVFLKTQLQIELLRKAENLNRLWETNNADMLFKAISGQVLTALLEEPRLRALLLESDLATLEHLVTTGLVVPKDIMQDRKFINKFLSIRDINKYREILNAFEEHNPYGAELIENLRYFQYKEAILNVNELGLTPKYAEMYQKIREQKPLNQLIENVFDIPVLLELEKVLKNQDDLLAFFQQLSEKEMLEMTVDTYFKDFSYDFLKNLKIFLNFYADAKMEIAPNYLNIYTSLINYASLSIENKQNLFEELSQLENPMGTFYDHFRHAKDSCYMAIKNNLLKGGKLESLKNEEMSQNLKVPVYELNGEEFYMLVTVTGMSRDNFQYGGFIGTPLNSSSLSLIGHNHITTFQNPEQQIVLGFDDFAIDRVLHLYESDSFSAHEYSSSRFSKIYTPDTLLAKTKGFNELLYLNTTYDQAGLETKDAMKPSYIVCYDVIKCGDLMAAKTSGNIPLILLHTKHYRRNNNAISYIEDTMNDSVYSSRHTTVANDYYRKI